MWWYGGVGPTVHVHDDGRLLAAHLPGKWCAGSNGFRVLRARSHVTPPPMTWAADDLGMPVGYLALPAPTRLLLQSACVLRGCARATKSQTCHLMFSSCAHRLSLGTPSAEDDTLGESAVRFPWGPSTCVPYPRARCPPPFRMDVAVLVDEVLQRNRAQG